MATSVFVDLSGAILLVAFHSFHACAALGSFASSVIHCCVAVLAFLWYYRLDFFGNVMVALVMIVIRLPVACMVCQAAVLATMILFFDSTHSLWACWEGPILLYGRFFSSFPWPTALLLAPSHYGWPTAG